LAKIILLVLGLLLVYWVLKRYRRRMNDDAGPRQGAGNEDMVRCERCGVHLPRSESIATHGRYYCSPEHQQAPPPQG
jgi:uncharacterized protein